MCLFCFSSGCCYFEWALSYYDFYCYLQNKNLIIIKTYFNNNATNFKNNATISADNDDIDKIYGIVAGIVCLYHCKTQN